LNRDVLVRQLCGTELAEIEKKAQELERGNIREDIDEG